MVQELWPSFVPEDAARRKKDSPPPKKKEFIYKRKHLRREKLVRVVSMWVEFGVGGVSQSRLPTVYLHFSTQRLRNHGGSLIEFPKVPWKSHLRPKQE